MSSSTRWPSRALVAAGAGGLLLLGATFGTLGVDAALADDTPPSTIPPDTVPIPPPTTPPDTIPVPAPPATTPPDTIPVPAPPEQAPPQPAQPVPGVPNYAG